MRAAGLRVVMDFEDRRASAMSDFSQKERHLAALSASVVLGVLLAAAPANAAEPPLSADAASAGAAWIMSFAAEPVPLGAVFEAPDYLGTEIEASLRAAMKENLLAQGFTEGARDGAGVITLSIKVDIPRRGPKGLPQSRLRLESIDRDLTDNIRDLEVRPVFSLGAPKRGEASPPDVRVTIYAQRDDARVWSGFAGAPFSDGENYATARRLFDLLIGHFGETVDLSEVHLNSDGGAAPR